MTSPVFVISPADLHGASAGHVVQLSGDEGRHAVTVMRLAVGESVDLVDGNGTRASGTVVAIDGKHTLHVEVVDIHVEAAPALRIVVAQALAKGDRGELAVAQLTEIGVDEIIPWAARHSVVQWRGDRAVKSAQRWSDAISAAAKQSRRARLPVLAPVVSSDGLRERVAAASAALVLHENAATAIGAVALPSRGDVLVVVGPEGGISPEELDLLTDAGATAVRLGPTVLRTSSAGMAAVAVLLSATDRWSIDAVEG